MKQYLALWGVLSFTLLQPVHAQQVFTAEIIDVPRDPVFGWQSPGPEFEAEIGTVIREGGYLRTVKPGKAQVILSNGLAFRLGGNAVLRVSNDMDLEQGRIIAWGEEPSAQPRTIETPVATAAILGTTAFIDAEPNRVIFFCWKGEVRVTLPDGSQSVTLTTGEEVTVEVGATDLPEPTLMSNDDVRARFAETDDLFSDFNAPMKSFQAMKRALNLD